MPKPEPTDSRNARQDGSGKPPAPAALAAPASLLAVCPSQGRRMKLPPVGGWALVRLWWGKVRRAMLGRVLKGVTRRRHARRRGQCLRCGACCQLGRICPSLTTSPTGGPAACEKYDSWRHLSCHLFPTTASDLRDRDLILPDTPCGYYFVDEKGQAGDD
jgi:hypothetical protein